LRIKPCRPVRQRIGGADPAAFRGRSQGPSRHHHHPCRRGLGEDEDWLRDVANEMEIEDGTIWVYGVGEDGVMAFTDFGIENPIELIRFYKENQELLRR